MRYNYRALDNHKQEVTGILNAKTEKEAVRQLQQRELVPIALKVSETKQRGQAKTGKFKQRDIIIVLHELATLIESNVTLIEAVESLAHSSHHHLITDTFAEIATQLRQGISFSMALQDSPLKLPWYMMQLIESGELTGQVASALRDGVTQMEYEARVANEMRNAMIYPSILIISGIAAILIIFIIVVPKFANILQNRSVDIPLLAKVVLETGMFFNNYFEWLIGGIVVLIIVFTYLLNKPDIKVKMKDLTAHLPLLGVWIIESETARWAAMMGTLLENRVSLLKALELANMGIKLPSLHARLGQVSRAVKSGINLSQALEDNETLTATGQNLIRAGEKAGKLPSMLHSLAKLLEESGRVRMKRFLLLLEPIAILLIGSIIGVIITGIILAITSVNQINF
ncbi:MAG: type II secretion system F family protein [Thiomargarita sp.]|nr:type II secretion system F family protein [Thiomargarita sp.]